MKLVWTLGGGTNIQTKQARVLRNKSPAKPEGPVCRSYH